MARRGWVSELTEKNENFLKSVQTGMINENIDWKDISKRLGVEPKTYYTDIKHPEKIPLGRLRLYRHVLHWSKEQLDSFI